VKVDPATVYALQEKLKPILDQIDALRRPLTTQDVRAHLYAIVATRMQRYKTRLAERHKIKKRKTAEIEKMFSTVVSDIADFAYTMYLKEKIPLSDFCTLHKKIYPKGLW